MSLFTSFTFPSSCFFFFTSFFFFHHSAILFYLEKANNRNICCSIGIANNRNILPSLILENWWSYFFKSTFLCLFSFTPNIYFHSIVLEQKLWLLLLVTGVIFHFFFYGLFLMQTLFEERITFKGKIRGIEKHKKKKN